MDTEDLPRQILIAGLSQGGIAGKFAGALVGFLWQPNSNVWEEIREKVEALINQKLGEYEYRTVSDSLAGLRKAMELYLRKLHDAHPAQISEQYTATNTVFVTALPHFQSKESKVLLLPLFAQFANLHLALLRDGALHGAEWGWKAEDVADEKKALADAISDYSAYALATYNEGIPTSSHPTYRENWTTRNAYVRGMTLSVLDHRHYWQFLESNAPPMYHPQRTIYSDPVGGGVADHISLPREISAAPMTALGAWGEQMVYGLRTAHAGQWGPPEAWTDRPAQSSAEVGLGLGQAAATGVSATLVPLAEHDLRWKKPFLGSNVCTALTVHTADGEFPLFRGDYPSPFTRIYSVPVSIKYASHVLSSAHVMSNVAGPFIFGFRLKESFV